MAVRWWRCVVAGTMAGLIDDLKAAINSLTHSDHKGLITAITSGCNLFLQFITLSADSKLDDAVSYYDTHTHTYIDIYIYIHIYIYIYIYQICYMLKFIFYNF